MALTLTQKIVRIAEALSDTDIPHAFGGALALAYCTQDPRGTNDIDLNVFVEVTAADRVLRLLPRGVVYDEGDLERIARDGQARLWWDGSPVDVFFSNHRFHQEARRRTRTVPFAGLEIQVLDCTDLAVFKAFFARPKDLVDIGTMAAAGTIDAATTLDVVGQLLGRDHPNWAKLRSSLDVTPS
jgi:hypothetical protein